MPKPVGHRFKMTESGYLVFGLGFDHAKKRINETGWTLFELIFKEGLRCFTDSRRLAQVRGHIYSHIRASGNYRGLVLRVVNDIVQVSVNKYAK